MVADLLYLAIEMKKTEEKEGKEEKVKLSTVYWILQGTVYTVAFIVVVMGVWTCIYTNTQVFTEKILHTFKNLQYWLEVSAVVAMILFIILSPLLIAAQIYFEVTFKNVIGIKSDEFGQCIKKQRVMFFASSVGLFCVGIIIIGQFIYAFNAPLID